MALWADLPAPCIAAIARCLHDDAPEAGVAARLACSAWAAAMPLPQLCVQMGDWPGARQLQLQPDAATAVQGSGADAAQLLHTLRQQVAASVALRNAPALALTTRCSCGSGAPAAAAGACDCQLVLAEALTELLPRATSLAVRAAPPADGALGPQGALASSPLDAAVSVLPQLPAATRSRLCSLTLSCSGAWPAPATLAAALTALPGLARLELRDCPVAVLARLPSLPALRALVVAGRPGEPVPPSYSIRAGPLLPLLPKLARLALAAMPLDLAAQEAEGVKAWLMTGQRRPAAAPPAAADAAGAADAAWQWRSQRQWVSTSIAAQCPKLQQVDSGNLPLNPVLLQDSLGCLTTLSWRPGGIMRTIHCRPALGRSS